MYLAKQAMPLDQLSDGRLVLGLSYDDRHRDYPMLGIDYHSRGDRYRDAWSVFRTPPLPPITIPNHPRRPHARPRPEADVQCLNHGKPDSYTLSNGVSDQIGKYCLQFQPFASQQALTAT